jgi:hypothetical protein
MLGILAFAIRLLVAAGLFAFLYATFAGPEVHRALCDQVAAAYKWVSLNAPASLAHEPIIPACMRTPAPPATTSSDAGTPLPFP